MSQEEPRKIRRRTRKKRSFNTVVQMRNDRSLLALLRDEVRFRWAVGGLVFFFALLGTLVPKVWVATPGDFTPVIKVSGLDLMQAASLRRTALSLRAAGDFQGSAQAWDSAIANNRADLKSLRGFLDLVGAEAQPDPHWSVASRINANFLLRLTGTNLTDLERTALAFEKFQYTGWVVEHLQARVTELTPDGLATLGRALFDGGDFAGFDTWWQEHGTKVAGIPEMPLYRAAWEAGWGPAVSAGPAREQLAAATRDPGVQVTALQLLLAAQARSLDTAGYEEALSRLEDLGRDRVVDHTRWWLLLRATGRTEEARGAARRFNRMPGTETESIHLTTAWRRLGLDDIASDFIKRGYQQAPMGDAARLQLAGALAEAERWDDLRVLAQQIRNRFGPEQGLGGYTYFLEGLAEDGLKQRPRAEQSFDLLLQHAPTNSLLCLQAAMTMMRIGYSDPAGRLLNRLEKDLGTRPDYWMGLADNAFAARDAAEFLYASQRAHQLHPQNEPIANFYAAALLANRTNAPEAVVLTLDLLNRHPNHPATRLNHALALVMNGRHREGLASLESLREESLPADLRSGWNLGRFEALVGLDRIDEAKDCASRVDPRDLFSPQATWFEDARAGLRRR